MGSQGRNFLCRRSTQIIQFFTLHIDNKRGQEEITGSLKSQLRTLRNLIHILSSVFAFFMISRTTAINEMYSSGKTS